MLVCCALECVGTVGFDVESGAVFGGKAFVAALLAMDAVAEWRALGRLSALVPLLRDQRVWLADLLADALSRHGVPAFVRSARYHQYRWWLAPQVPAVVMVPRERVDEARALLAGWRGAECDGRVLDAR